MLIFRIQTSGPHESTTIMPKQPPSRTRDELDEEASAIAANIEADHGTEWCSPSDYYLLLRSLNIDLDNRLNDLRHEIREMGIDVDTLDD